MDLKDKKLIYLYCVTKSVPKLEKLGNMACDLRCVSHCGLYAVIGLVPENEFCEDNLEKNLANLDWVKSKVIMHERVIEDIMKNNQLVPFKFATVFNNEENLKMSLEKYAHQISENLNNIKDREEWGVKIYYNKQILRKIVASESSSVMALENEIKSTPSGKAFFLKKKKEELIDKTINSKLIEYGKQCFDVLKKISYEARINKLLSKELTNRKEEMILNLALLVDKEKVGEFKQIVEFLKFKYNDGSLVFDCTGPWPPYNFCQIIKDRQYNA